MSISFLTIWPAFCTPMTVVPRYPYNAEGQHGQYTNLQSNAKKALDQD